MGRCITLVDDRHPEEPLEVEVVQFGKSFLRLVVPNTLVRFELKRHDADTPFEGELGGR